MAWGEEAEGTLAGKKSLVLLEWDLRVCEQVKGMQSSQHGWALSETSPFSLLVVWPPAAALSLLS